MGYKQPFKQIGKVEPELRNQSKSGLRMNDASPLNKPKDPTEGEEKLLSKETTKTRETTPEGITGTRVTTTSQYETPGGEVKRTAEGDRAYAALTPEQRKAQDEKFLAKQRSETQTRFTPDAIKIKTQGLTSVKPKLTGGSMPGKIDTVIGGGDYKFDLSGKKPSYNIFQETKQAFGGGTTSRFGQGRSNVEQTINQSQADKASSTGSRNILKVADISGDFLTGRPESEKAQYLLKKEREKELASIRPGQSLVGDPEAQKLYTTAQKSIMDKYKKLSSDIQATYTSGHGLFGKKHRYTERLKAANKPVYNSETGLNLFNKK